jgi:hypothetical protein
MQDVDVIEKFKSQIAWADETELIQDGDRVYLATDIALYIPTHWREVNTPALVIAAAIHKRECVALVWGDPSTPTATEISHRLICAGIHVRFVDPVGRIAWAQFVSFALDGIDWLRTSESIGLNGESAKPVFEWEAESHL